MEDGGEDIVMQLEWASEDVEVLAPCSCASTNVKTCLSSTNGFCYNSNTYIFLFSFS